MRGHLTKGELEQEIEVDPQGGVTWELRRKKMNYL